MRIVWAPTRHEDGIPQIDSITDDDEYEAAADRFDEMLDDDYFNALEDEE